MKEAKNELMQFVGGVIMLVVGLYILSQKVMVSSSYGFFSMWGGRFSSGLIMVPLIIGVVWMFATGVRLICIKSIYSTFSDTYNRFNCCINKNMACIHYNV